MQTRREQGTIALIGPILIGPILIGLALLLAACARGPAVTPIPPTPFPTLPLTPTPTATPYVFVPGGGTAATPMPAGENLPARGGAEAAEGGALPVDGELVTLIPPLGVSFPPGVSGRLETVHVGLGQWVAEGDRIATLDAPDLQRALYDAQRAVEQARALRVAAEARAADAYQRAQQRAQWDLERAWHAVQVAEKRPPTAAAARAQAALDGARRAEAIAADAHKQSLDRSWEASEVREGLYNAWQAAITARKLAELDLQDAQLAVEVHTMNLAALRQEVGRARTALEGLQQEVDPALEWAESAALQALTAAQERLALTELYAPRAGMVVAVGAAAGATVGSGTPVVTLLDTQELRFVARSMDERQAAALRPGQGARIVLRFYPETLIEAQVEMLVPAVQSSARFEVYLRLVDTAGLALLPGMTGRAEIDVGQD